MRHPIYAAYLLLFAGAMMLAANLAVGLPGLCAVGVLVAVRVPLEETMLEERFGPAYRAWHDRTGRLLPRLRAAATPVEEE